MNYRLLEKNDFNKGFLCLLEQLTIIGNISKTDFISRFRNIMDNKNHLIYVLEKNKKIVSCATLFIEPKFIHDCGFVGHIEDVIIDKACRGQNLGKQIITFLTNKAQELGCYKILLDCSDKNVGFYEKCDYLRKGAYMAKYLNPIKRENLQMGLFGFCKTYYREIIIINLSITTGYLLYKYWNLEEIEEEKKN